MIKMSNTIQRRIILEELQKLKTHPNAEELYKTVRARLPKISLGTVYRNLDVLADAGLLTKMEITGKEKRFDGNTEPHFHLRCIDCDSIEDLEMDPLLVNSISTNLRAFLKERIHAANIDFSGYCVSCAAKHGHLLG